MSTPPTVRTPTWSSRPTGERQRSPTWPTRSASATVSGWATPSLRGAARATTTRPWASPPEALTPPELVSAILTASADMLWLGGIGTFVKAAAETHAEVGDRANDAVRVDADQVRARVVVEGGNLGFTQRARIVYSRRGGKIN